MIELTKKNQNLELSTVPKKHFYDFFMTIMMYAQLIFETLIEQSIKFIELLSLVSQDPSSGRRTLLNDLEPDTVESIL